MLINNALLIVLIRQDRDGQRPNPQLDDVAYQLLRWCEILTVLMLFAFRVDVPLEIARRTRRLEAVNCQEGWGNIADHRRDTERSRRSRTMLPTIERDSYRIASIEHIE